MSYITAKKCQNCSKKFCFHVDNCDSKPCKTEQQLCNDIAGECTCRKGLTLDVNDRCVGKQTLVMT